MISKCTSTDVSQLQMNVVNELFVLGLGRCVVCYIIPVYICYISGKLAKYKTEDFQYKEWYEFDENWEFYFMDNKTRITPKCLVSSPVYMSMRNNSWQQFSKTPFLKTFHNFITRKHPSIWKVIVNKIKVDSETYT